jgi:transcription-repair coupling factor (superfamily II helicase)
MKPSQIAQQQALAALRARRDAALAHASAPGTSVMQFRECIRLAATLDQRIKALWRDMERHARMDRSADASL